MKKVLFLIHDLGPGGAEKVLVNLVNNMDKNKFDITVMALFAGGVNEQFLSSEVRLIKCFSHTVPGNSHLMKLLSPEKLHDLLIKEYYDIEISYLEGPCARIISGCKAQNTKKVCWIHIEQKTDKKAACSFRSIKEAKDCYGQFDKIVCVSKTVQRDFEHALSVKVPYQVLYNTNESEKIRIASKEEIDLSLSDDEVKLIGVGKLLKNKGFDRFAHIQKRLLKEGYPVHAYILGIGPEKDALEKYALENNMSDKFTLLGYQTNPYKYVAKSDLFICSSYAEGFSTAATEALIVGTPVCTVEVSGMKEMLGENNEYGLIVPNDEEELYIGIKKLLDESELLEYYRKQAGIRGNDFSTKETVCAVEKMLEEL